MHRVTIMSAIIGVCLAQPALAQARDTSVTAQGAPAQPSCCSIVRIDTAHSIVTARETATGYTFRFEVKARRLRRTLKIGQPIWADFTTNTVKLRSTDATPCCGIVPQETP
jgi:hypothetical protein